MKTFSLGVGGTMPSASVLLLNAATGIHRLGSGAFVEPAPFGVTRVRVCLAALMAIGNPPMRLRTLA